MSQQLNPTVPSPVGAAPAGHDAALWPARGPA